MSDTFLSKKDVRDLTDRAHRSKQIQALKDMGVPFFVSGTGWPKVTHTAVEGRPGAAATAEPKKGWAPRVLAG